MMISGDLYLVLKTLSFGLYFVAEGPSTFTSLCLEFTYTSGLIFLGAYGFEYAPGAGVGSSFLCILPSFGFIYPPLSLDFVYP